MVALNNDWDEILKDDFESENYKALREFLKREYFSHTVYPPMHDIYNAFKATPYGKVKVVIIGQDPYHNEGQAHGMCFSVLPGVQPPPSLVNIYKELQKDLGLSIPSGGFLEPWARQGVLLLNAVLTVRANAASSHAGKGWEAFTDSVIAKLNKRQKPVIFMLWGGYAKKKALLIDRSRHFILESAHPSPLSVTGFFGCRHFSRANEILKSQGDAPINWQI